MTTAEEHFGLLGPLHASGAQVVVAEPEADAILAAVTPRTRLLARLAGALDERPRCCRCGSCASGDGVPVLVDGAQSVGRDPRRRGGPRLPDDLRARSGSAARTRPARSSSPTPSGCASRGRATSRRPPTSPAAAFEPREGAARFEPNWHLGERPRRAARGARRRAGVGVRAGRRAGAPLPRAARAARRARPRRRDARRRSARSEPTELVARLAEAGVVVRELPGRNLVRASVGWWTSDDDLARLPRLQRSRPDNRATCCGRPRRAGSGGRGLQVLRLVALGGVVATLLFVGSARPPARASRSSSASRRTCRRRSARLP